MKKTLFTITILLIIAALSACMPIGNNVVVETTQADTVQNNNFIFTIVADNSVYKAHEPIEYYATVTYTGEEPIMIYHAEPLVAFGLEGGEYFEGGYMYNDMMEQTKFEQTDDVLLDEKRFEFQKSLAWESSDSNAAFYEALVEEEELSLPEGEYTLSAIMVYSTDQNDMKGTEQVLETSIIVTVWD